MSELRGTLFGRCACCPPMGRREFLAGGIAALGLGAFAAGRNRNNDCVLVKLRDMLLP